CQRKKTAELLNGYASALKELNEEAPLFMVTLTAKNIKATSPKALRDEIRLYNKEFTRIKDNIRKTHSMTLNGFKKVECTHNENTDEYHPHLHLIIQGQAEAELVKAYWITQMKKRHGRNKVSNTGQKVVILGTEESDLVEVFKYATKGSVKDSEQAKAEDLMFGAIEGLQIFKPIGKVKRTKRTSEEGTAGIKADWIESKNQNFKWNTKQKDYLSKEGLPLVGTQVIDELIEIKATINTNLNQRSNGRKTIQSGSGQRNYSISSISNNRTRSLIQSNG
ncbi:MAG: protein rep, partial [Flavobacteriales bacterium]